MRGLETFKTYFSEFDNYYVLIGGTACTILFEEAGLDFPQMVELFAREPNEFKVAEGYHLIPLHIADDTATLSAILLNSDYYNFLLQGNKNIEGLSLLDELRLIPFKAKAWCELTDRHNAGEEGLSKHIKKHRNDVAKLLTLISADVQTELHGMVEADMKRFVEAMRVDILDEHVTGVKGITTDLFCTRLHEIYRL